MTSLPSLLALPPDERKASGLLHTPQEISQQPETWLATYRSFRERHAEVQRFLHSAGLKWDPAQRPTVFLIGAGTSDYIGRSLAQLLRRCWRCEVLAVPSTDLLTHSEQWLLPGRNYLWISFSRSGESPEGLAVIERALKNHPGIHHLIVTCNGQGKMRQMAERRPQMLAAVLPDEVNDRGLAMTSSFSNMVVFGQCLAHIDSLEGYEKVLGQMAEAGTKFLETASGCAAELAQRKYAKACFVGSGPLKAVATESALKVLELTAGRVQTMSESALGLRHGPMAALDDQTVLAAFLSGDAKVLGYEMDLLEEISKKKLVKTRIIVTAAPNERLYGLAEYVLTHALPPGFGDDYRPPLDVILGQSLGLFFSLHYGLKPDCPSPNGAISRVVQNVLIHS
jgi:tagatose-6-phosphate ketose/aldose isomerase